MNPINYALDVKNPFDSVLQGVNTGFQIGQAMDQNAARQQAAEGQRFALEQQRVATQQQQQMQAEMGQLAHKQNPTAADFANITIKYPALTENYTKTWGTLNTEQQQTRLGQASQVMAAINAGKPDIARQLLDEQAVAAKNSGDVNGQKSAETMSKLVEMNPQMAHTSVGLMLASVMGPDKFTSTFQGVEKLPGEVAKTSAEAGKITAEGEKIAYEANNTPERLQLENTQKAWEIRNLDSVIADRAGRLALDRDKLQSETETKLAALNKAANPALNLDPDARKIINESTTLSVSSEQSAKQMLSLAANLEREGGGYGAAASASEWLKRQLGGQDPMSALRKEYIRMRSSQVLKLLPPGPATDKDVALAMSGFPPETAGVSELGSFLRGMAKLNQHAAVAENAKSEWVNNVGHLGKSTADMTVDGVDVSRGTTFTDFARKYVDKKASVKSAEAAQEGQPTRSYMRVVTNKLGTLGATGRGQ